MILWNIILLGQKILQEDPVQGWNNLYNQTRNVIGRKAVKWELGFHKKRVLHLD